jgi:hypothetical protein
MTTPTQPLDLHAGARKIAEDWASDSFDGSVMIEEIVALAEAHAAEHAAPLREAMEAARAKLESLAEHMPQLHCLPVLNVVDGALAPGAGDRWAARHALLEKVAEAATAWLAEKRSLDSASHASIMRGGEGTVCANGLYDAEQRLADALAALDAQEKR